MKNHYLHLLITCGKNQSIALLETADKNQVKEVVKLIYNLSLNSSILSSNARKLLSKNKKLIIKITNKKNSDKTNYSLLRINSLKFFNILSASRNTLLKVLP